MKSDKELMDGYESCILREYTPETYSLTIDEAVRICELNIEAFQERKARIEAMRPKTVRAVVFNCPGIGDCPKRAAGCNFYVACGCGAPSTDFIQAEKPSNCYIVPIAIRYVVRRDDLETHCVDASHVQMRGV